MTEALIRLRLSEIEYDVKFDTWARGNVLETPNEKVLYKEKMRDWLLRQIENAVGEIKAALRWCCVDHAHMTDDEIREEAPEAWEIHLRWKGEWKGSESGLKSFAHQYVVKKALGEWYRMVGMPVAPSANAEGTTAEELLTKLKNSARKTSVDTEFRL